jgi:hypothetical protein
MGTKRQRRDDGDADWRVHAEWGTARPHPIVTEFPGGAIEVTVVSLRWSGRATPSFGSEETGSS